MVEYKTPTTISRCPSSKFKLEAQDLVEAQSQKQDKALDEALELTFPASDPVAVSHTPSSSGLSRVNWPFR